MKIRNILATTALGAVFAGSALAHPLDGLTQDELQQINTILKDSGTVTDETLYPLIDLHEPSKAEVLDWKEGDALDRKAMVQYTTDEGFSEAIVNITQGTVEENFAIEGSGQPMVLFAEFIGALEGALGHPDMIAGLEARGLTNEDAFCLPLTAGNFFTPEFDGTRLMKVPCYQNPTGSNFYAKPIEGLFAIYDIGKQEVVEVIDTGAIPLP